MTRGASQFITDQDLVPLKESDESANLGADLQRALQKQYVTFYPIPKQKKTHIASITWGA